MNEQSGLQHKKISFRETLVNDQGSNDSHAYREHVTLDACNPSIQFTLWIFI